MYENFSEVRFEKLRDMKAVSYSVISEHPKEEAVIYLDNWARANGYTDMDNVRNFGFDIFVNERQQKEGLRGYEYWLTVPDDITITESKDVKIKEIPEDEYAVIRISDPFNDPLNKIPAGWRKLHEWVRNSGYRQRKCGYRYWLEEVIEHDGETFMDLYYPIDRPNIE